MHKHQYEQAINCYEKQLAIELNIFGTNHINVATSYNNLGTAYNKRKHYNQAINCYEKALHIRQHHFGNKNRLVADVICNLAMVFETNGEIKTAYKYYEEAWRIYSVVLGQFEKKTLTQIVQSFKIINLQWITKRDSENISYADMDSLLLLLFMTAKKKN
ncbi:hypothetical protein RFI_04160 [Reticulomyxa filosa]|uniref:Uncharacterized protein n=1 Tax=Reticulomyxa filosa TaxID=46433 RepID=X6P499_RETFI|nr:hypothetical protein RFI_04160 [Reticulomyxa filosa]|eukprot:ETO32948.1 hypothetical protein RFI_04160 [Reticulomyxa filosa]